MNLHGKGDTACPYSTTILSLAELLEWKTLWGMNAALELVKWGISGNLSIQPSALECPL